MRYAMRGIAFALLLDMFLTINLTAEEEAQFKADGEFMHETQRLARRLCDVSGMRVEIDGTPEGDTNYAVVFPRGKMNDLQSGVAGVLAALEALETK
jgi:hypothetical protein